MTVLAAGVVVLGGCGSDDEATGGNADNPASASPSAETANAVLATGDTDLGTVVVDAKGMTVYVFDKDTPGSGVSTCTGGCLEAWPPVVADSDSPVVEGVDGDVGAITRDDGTKQVTLDGYPLYYRQGDANAGDATGQGVQGVWWVVAPDGTKITETAAPASGDGY